MFTNFYACDKCEVYWTDESESMNNDRCPKCYKEIEPEYSLEYLSEELKEKRLLDAP